MLQWREQLIADEGMFGSRIAVMEIWQALSDLASRLTGERFLRSA
ncbi:hypothetical protein ABTY96_28885 [Streptomyces sp. NPDC096057]